LRPQVNEANSRCHTFVSGSLRSLPCSAGAILVRWLAESSIEALLRPHSMTRRADRLCELSHSKDRNRRARYACRLAVSGRRCQSTVISLSEYQKVRCSTMNFMQPNSGQASVARTTQVPVPASNQISVPKRIALFCVFILTVFCTLAWVTFLARVAWSLI
jgi:hypothetical protein